MVRISLLSPINCFSALVGQYCYTDWVWVALTEKTILPAVVLLCPERRKGKVALPETGSYPCQQHAIKQQQHGLSFLGQSRKPKPFLFFKIKHKDNNQEYLSMFLKASWYKHLANNVWQIISENTNVINWHAAECSIILIIYF